MAFIEVDGIADPIDMGEDFDALSEDKQHELIDKKVAAIRAKQKTSTGEKSMAENKLAGLAGGAMIGVPAGYGVAAAGQLLPDVPAPRGAAASQFQTPVEVANRAIAARQAPPTGSAMPQAVENWVNTQQGGTKPQAANYKQAGSFAEEALQHETANPTRKVLEESRFSVPKEVAAQIKAEKEAAAVAQTLKHQQEVNAVAKLRADRLAQLKNTVFPGEKLLAGAGTAGNALMNMTKGTIPRLAGHAISGAGVGLSAADVAERLQRGEYGRAAISTLGGAGDVATMTRNPVAMALGLPVGIGAPLVNMGLDAMLGRGELPVHKANGGLVYLAEGGDPKKPRASIAGTLQSVGTVQGPNLSTMARDYINELPAKTAQNAIHLNDIVQKSNPYSMNPRDPLFTPDPNYDPQASREFNDFAAGNLGGAIKNVGGNWLQHGLTRAVDEIRPLIPSLGKTNFDSALDIANPAKIQAHVNEMKGVGYAPEQIQDFHNNVALSNWLDNKLTKYVKNDMGTPNDPVRQLSDKGISHIQNIEEVPIDKIRAQFIAKERRAEGFPHTGYAETPAGKNWEMLTDTAISPGKLSDWANATGPVKVKNPWIDTVLAKDPEAKVNQIDNRSDFRALQFNHLTDELQNAINPNSGLPAHLRLKPEALDRVTVPQAVERVAKINAWRQMQIENAAKQNLSDFPVLHEAADGFKVHELKMPNTGQKDDYIKLQNALKNEGEQMGHCVGGYCDDVANGSSRIFSLRDSKGGSHATIEAYPSLDSSMAFYEANKEALESPLLKEKAQFINESAINPGEYLNDIKKLMDKHNIPYTDVLNTKFDINQIKGKSNGPVSEKYRQHIKDFLNKHADNIGDVSELENVGLHRPGSDLTQGGPLREKVVSSILEKRPNTTVNFEDLKKHVGNKFYGSVDEIIDDYIQHLDKRK
jgi:hypothetical protein